MGDLAVAGLDGCGGEGVGAGRVTSEHASAVVGRRGDCGGAGGEVEVGRNAGKPGRVGQDRGADEADPV